jgi:hypothetical protein
MAAVEVMADGLGQRRQHGRRLAQRLAIYLGGSQNVSGLEKGLLVARDEERHNTICLDMSDMPESESRT